MLSCNIPSDAPDRVRDALERLPNYCPDCGMELVLTGEGIDPRDGFYEHIDPEVICMGGCRRRWRFGVAFAKEQGLNHYTHNLTRERADEIFGEFDGWCNIHGERMIPTKSLMVDSDPARQFKCPECEQLATFIFGGGGE